MNCYALLSGLETRILKHVGFLTGMNAGSVIVQNIYCL